MAGIYFHFPFCKQACDYCNFHFSTQKKFIKRMLFGMSKELILRKNELQQPIKSIYFGGGSPSLMSISSLKNFIELIKNNFKLSEKVEVTIEVNPDDISLNYLYSLSESGVNRISLGLQSFENKELILMNRVHNAEQGLQALEWTSKVFENYSLDLIFGVPFSNITSWNKNLDITLSFKPPHISAYALTIESNTVLSFKVKNKLIELLDEEIVKEQYDLLISKLEEASYENYEFSNFSKLGFESINNFSYWSRKPYLGIGPSAHSYDGIRRRSWNISNNLKYLKFIEKGELSSKNEILNDNDLFNEYVMIGLRTRGVSLNEINQIFGIKYAKYFEQNLEKKIINRTLFWDGDFIKVSKDLRFLSDGIASDLFVLKA